MLICGKREIHLLETHKVEYGEKVEVSQIVDGWIGTYGPWWLPLQIAGEVMFEKVETDPVQNHVEARYDDGTAAKTCSTCNKIFSRRDNMLKHARNVHASDERIKGPPTRQSGGPVGGRFQTAIVLLKFGYGGRIDFKNSVINICAIYKTFASTLNMI